MGKALLLKNVDFAANKLDTVTYSEIIPCTGVTLSQNTISFAAFDATVQLSAAKAPANTTDDLIWASSDAAVATVSSDGLVTCKGIGSATITATCGEQTATCAVTATITIDAMTAYDHVDGYEYSGSVNFDQNKNHIGKAINAGGRIFYESTKEYTSNNRAFYYDATPEAEYNIFNSCYGIPIPHGTSVISVDTNGVDSSRFAIIAGNSSVRANAYSSSARPNFAAVSIIATISLAQDNLSLDISSVIDEADVFVVCLKDPDGDPTVFEHVYVTFS